MGWGYRRRCPSCLHEWRGVATSARLGRWSKASFPKFRDAFRTWACPRCDRTLSLPRLTDRNSWRKWHEQKGGWATMPGYLEAIAVRIDACLAGRRPYTPAVIDLEPGHCPGCSEPFEEVTGEDYRPACPRCGARSDDLADDITSHCSMFPDEYGFA